MSARVEYHPEFAEQFEQLPEVVHFDVFADVAALVSALETHGHDIEGEDHTADPSHPIKISDLDLWALRRTPATGFTPDANEAPILRIPYVWMIDREQGDEFALVLFIGDKTELANQWYQQAVTKIEGTLIPLWEAQNPNHEARKKRRGTA